MLGPLLVALLGLGAAARRLPHFQRARFQVLEEDITAYGAPADLPNSVSRDRQVFAYGAAPSLDPHPTHVGGASSLRDPAGGVKDPSLQNEKQVVTGIPDLSDPCFRRYANSIIVNAQPYERRSSIALQQCKTQCLLSQLGVYSCRSFVYDNVNQVCDLFAHVGDQSPARLLRFQTRDYFEPTAAVSCKAPEQREDPALVPTTQKSFFELTSRTTFAATEEPATPAPLAVAAVSELTPVTEQLLTSAPPAQPRDEHAHFNNVPVLDPSKGTSCENGEVPRYLKTADFELHQHDDMRLESVSLDECIEFCSSSSALKSAGAGSPRCNSFEYGEGVCVLSRETAVPLGNGQLKQRPGTDYYEKVCVEEKLTSDCPLAVYNRFPQKILVGFAETVVDAPSLQHCFDNCLNSRQLYGFKCVSGMYYFEEPQLNCILNTEDRASQPDLFTSENSDLVDYFETSCNQSSASRRFASPSTRRGQGNTLKKKDFVDKEEAARGNRLLRDAQWTSWSPCAEGATQTRQKVCEGGRVCGRDVRDCDKLSRTEEEMTIAEMVDMIRRSGCPPDVCCPVLGKCFGLVQKSATRRLEWCSTCDGAHDQ